MHSNTFFEKMHKKRRKQQENPTKNIHFYKAHVTNSRSAPRELSVIKKRIKSALGKERDLGRKPPHVFPKEKRDSKAEPCIFAK